MADDNKGHEPPPSAGPAESKSSARGALIVPLINTVCLLVTIAFAVHSKLLYKRPRIREISERERLLNLHKTVAAPEAPSFIPFGSITANIASNPDEPRALNGTSAQIEGKLHYATMDFSLEVRDAEHKDLVEAMRPLLMDKLNSILGKKHYHELVTVQGRYLLQLQVIEVANQLVATLSPHPMKDDFVTNLFFTQFVVQ